MIQQIEVLLTAKPRGCHLVTEEILSHYNYSRKEICDQKVFQFMYEHKTGRYAIFTKTHVCAYVNGIWYDNEFCFNGLEHFLYEKILFVYSM